ncbi:cell division protein FtsQ/DivIB [Azohydromonas caseinilytica]|uniref:Cell division protein FtsQ n=1 Tax=Azohydromonas caseinilytica TaxID=2728836 RepID=A0A848FGT3_9BURK|nr:cell division protein FtsQ/DivIB [Azohydromonas caseinilytica]NML18472.1 FtsQ-type POTRA domain-containing protein [Azohydromonas caseinilytica]
MAARATVPLPPDVRLTNAVASLIYAAVLLALLGVAAQWASRLPLFALRVVSVDGEFERSNPAQLRNEAVPQLRGNFFTLDLQAAREAFEALPWVRQAVLHRVFPNRLEVRLLEHRAAAIWAGGEEGADRLVSTQGEIFEANVGDVEDEGLPVFEGGEDSAMRMLGLYERLAPVFAPMGGIRRLRLSQRGSWSVELGTGNGAGPGRGAQVELGRGTDVDIAARSERFVRTLPQVTTNYGRPLQYADLRHKDGYVVRLQGITTTLPVAAVKKSK